MEIRGTIIYCNNCGLKIFRRGHVVVDYKAYPAMPHWKDIDPLPEGWIQIGNDHLCPECSNKWKLSVSRINEISEELLKNPLLPRTMIQKMLDSIKVETVCFENKRDIGRTFEKSPFATNNDSEDARFN